MTNKKGEKLHHRCGKCGERILYNHWFTRGQAGRPYDHVDCKNPIIHPPDGGDALKPKCQDCGLPYSDFGLDVTIPDEQWLAIHPSGKDGLLCARCIVSRASKLGGVVAVRAVLDYGPSPIKTSALDP